MKPLAWYKIIPTDLLEIAYGSTYSLAWPKEQALQVLDALSANGYVIVGIDAWLPTSPGPSQLPYDWNIDINPHSKIFANTPRQFIEEFEVRYGQKPVFNFAVKP